MSIIPTPSTAVTSDDLVNLTRTERDQYLADLGAAKDSTVLHKSGAETVTGVKTFDQLPVFNSDATTGGQAVRKSQMDNLDAGNVKLTGNQTVAGIKTFSSSPVVPTPTSDSQAANKGMIIPTVRTEYSKTVTVFTPQLS